MLGTLPGTKTPPPDLNRVRNIHCIANTIIQDVHDQYNIRTKDLCSAARYQVAYTRVRDENDYSNLEIASHLLELSSHNS